MNVGRSVISITSASTISTLSVPIPVDMQLSAHAAVGAGGGRDLAVAALQLHAVPACRDLRHAAGVTDEQDVLGELATLQRDVVLAVASARRVCRRVVRHTVLIAAVDRPAAGTAGVYAPRSA